MPIDSRDRRFNRQAAIIGLCVVAALAARISTVTYFDRVRDAQAGIVFACYLPLLIIPFAVAVRLLLVQMVERVLAILAIAISILLGTGILTNTGDWSGILGGAVCLTSAMFIVGTAIAALDTSARPNAPPDNLCPSCRYDLRGSPSGRCPECGTDARSPTRSK